MLKQYNAHKSNAKMRGIQFDLSYKEWHRIWKDSGKIDCRGTHFGEYSMCRFFDRGGYDVNNVYIALSTDNTKHYHQLKRYEAGFTGEIDQWLDRSTSYERLTSLDPLNVLIAAEENSFS